MYHLEFKMHWFYHTLADKNYINFPKFYNGLVQIMFQGCVTSLCVPATEFLPDVSEMQNHLNGRGFWKVPSPVSCSKQAEDLVGISQKDAKAQQCWGTALVGTAFRKLLSSCLNCQCEKVCQKVLRPGCLKTGIKDLGFFPALCIFLYLGLGAYQPCFDQNEITLPSRFGSCPGQQLRAVGYKGSGCSSSTVFSVDVAGALWGCCENIRLLCQGEHKHPQMVFVPYFTPAHPLPLFFSP